MEIVGKGEFGWSLMTAGFEKRAVTGIVMREDAAIDGERNRKKGV